MAYFGTRAQARAHASAFGGTVVDLEKRGADFPWCIPGQWRWAVQLGN